MKNAIDYICSSQLNWASENSIKTRDGYTLSLRDNLFQTICDATSRDFQGGKGSELGDGTIRCKMQALHSSSALVVNFFDYWRKNGNVAAIAKACGSPDPLSSMRFEATHTNPVGRTKPHLDLEFYGDGCKSLAIESKFTEVYHRKTRRDLSVAYIKKTAIWEGFKGCRELAVRIDKERTVISSFQYLDAPQLLKHILGLKTDYPGGFTLLYLWYGVDSPEAKRHWNEIVEFESYIKDEVDFQVLTYQQLFTRVAQIQRVDEGYLQYLKNRYF